MSLKDVIGPRKNGGMCYCGSGKKYKHCHKRASNARLAMVRIELPEGLAAGGKFVFNVRSRVLEAVRDKNGRNVPFTARESAMVMETESGRMKVLASVPLDGGEAHVDPNRALLEFDDVYAIDTNTIEIKNTKVSVTATAHVILRDHGDAGVHCEVIPSLAFELHDLEADEERYGWALAIRKLEQYLLIRDGHRIAIIVDAHRGSLEAINCGAEPIIGDVRVPNGCLKFVYAADRSRGDSALQLGLRTANKMSELLLREISQRFDLHGMSEGEGMPFKRYRMRLIPSSETLELLRRHPEILRA